VSDVPALKLSRYLFAIWGFSSSIRVYVDFMLSFTSRLSFSLFLGVLFMNSVCSTVLNYAYNKDIPV